MSLDQHPSFPQPAPMSRLWRYMDWEPKFTGLVRERRLWMSWLPMLEDKHEGKTPQNITEELQQALLNATNDVQRTAIKNNIAILRRFASTFYPNYFVSCWSMNEFENDLMWRSYTTSGEAVAVQTTFERLKQSLPDYLNIGLVRYIDYKTQGFRRVNMLEWPMHKRLHYVGDNEVRVLADARTPDEFGGKELREILFESETSSPYLRICAPPADLSVLIEAIHLHPRADEAFAAKVVEFCRDQELPKPQRSELTGVGAF